MSILAGLKQLQPINRNRLWWSTPLPISTKLRYYPSMAAALTKSLVAKNWSISYLGHKLRYDNFATPFSLQAYPREISESILKNTPKNIEIKKVLDIGGNIGQFSITLSHFLGGDVQIDVLEPNPDIFEIIKNNTSQIPRIAIYNFGVGKTGKSFMFYTPGKSATGSVFSKNTSSPKNAKKIEIQLTDDVQAITGRGEYDLIKIDVEGYEYDLIEALRPIKTKLMFIEVSSLGRYKNFYHSELLALIEKRFGKFDILHSSGSEAMASNFDLLLQFV